MEQNRLNKIISSLEAVEVDHEIDMIQDYILIGLQLIRSEQMDEVLSLIRDLYREEYKTVMGRY